MTTSTQIFLDSVIIEDIREFSWLISGITTTPTFFAREGIDYKSFISDFVAAFPDLELHTEALGSTTEETKKEIENIISEPWFNKDKIVLKIPISAENMQLVKTYSKAKIRFNTHLIFTPEQAFLAAQAGTDYICPLLGRYANHMVTSTTIGENDFDHARSLIESVMNVLEETRLRSSVNVMASSLRTTDNLLAALQAGADAVTIPSFVLREAFNHNLTTDGVKKFLEDMAG
jgi:transaldolase